MGINDWNKLISYLNSSLKNNAQIVEKVMMDEKARKIK